MSFVMNKKILIAVAWPYANGSLHFGHAAALIGGDVLARYHRLRGDHVLFVSGSDCHGTPIAVEADKQGVHPSMIAETYHKEFVETLVKGLLFSYDTYTTTTTENHAQTVQEIFLALYEKELIIKKTEELPYCVLCKRFLPDRYIEGECPKCHFGNARGDQCDNCGELLDPKDLLHSKCKICGTAPEWRESEHFYLKLSVFADDLKKWIEKSTGWRTEAKNFSLTMLEQGLHDRAITRDTEWGITIPIAGYEEKRIYVWFDAVCGYLSASKEWAKTSGNPDAWKDFWQNTQAFHYYVHGKDNILFHTIIWPAMLLGFHKDFHLPDRIYSSAYLTLEKQQFSKSRHHAVWLPDFLKTFDSETLRYVLIANGPETSDADFSWGEYAIKTNKELIGNFGNFINRTLSLIRANFPDGVRVSKDVQDHQKEFLDHVHEIFSLVGTAIEQGNFKEAIRTVCAITDEGNKFINDTAPWVSVKTDAATAAGDLAVAAYAIHCLSILTQPFLPRSAGKIARALEITLSDVWKAPDPIVYIAKEVEPLYKKIEDSEVEYQKSLLGKM